MTDFMRICQTNLPLMPWMRPRGLSLPGLQPVEDADRVIVDDAFAAQMAYREHLIEERRKVVYQALPSAEHHATAVLEEVTDLLRRRTDYQCAPSSIRRPDGVEVDLTKAPPLVVLGCLIQEDVAILEKVGDEHRLTAGLLCFPAHWRLSEKLGRSLFGVHDPVADYDAGLNRRVERILNMIRPGQPLMRANALIYTNPDLHQPVAEAVTKDIEADQPRYVRVERQTLARLKRTGAIVFSIHTYLMPLSVLPRPAYKRLAATRPRLAPTEG